MLTIKGRNEIRPFMLHWQSSCCHLLLTKQTVIRSSKQSRMRTTCTHIAVMHLKKISKGGKKELKLSTHFFIILYFDSHGKTVYMQQIDWTDWIGITSVNLAYLKKPNYQVTFKSVKL